MRAVFFSMALLASGNAVAVESSDYRALVDAIYGGLTMAYVCQEKIGDSHFNLQRTISVMAARDVGMSGDEATLAIADAIEKIKREVAQPIPNLTASACYDQIADAKFKIDVEKAKLLKAAKP